MDFILFWGILSLLIEIIWTNIYKEEADGGLVFIVSILLGALIFGLSVKPVELGNLDSNLKLIVNETMTNDELESEIKKLVSDETGDKISNISVNVKDNKLNEIIVKDVEVEIKKSIIVENLFCSIDKEFQIIIKDEDIEIVMEE